MAKEEDFAAMFAEYEAANKGKRRAPPVQPGDRVRGKVTSVGRDTVFIELDDGRGEGMIDGAELRDADGQVTIKTGDSDRGDGDRGRRARRADGATAPAGAGFGRAGSRRAGARVRAGPAGRGDDLRGQQGRRRRHGRRRTWVLSDLAARYAPHGRCVGDGRPEADVPHHQVRGGPPRAESGPVAACAARRGRRAPARSRRAPSCRSARCCPAW